MVSLINKVKRLFWSECSNSLIIHPTRNRNINSRYGKSLMVKLNCAGYMYVQVSIYEKASLIYNQILWIELRK